MRKHFPKSAVLALAAHIIYSLIGLNTLKYVKNEEVSSSSRLSSDTKVHDIREDIKKLRKKVIVG